MFQKKNSKSKGITSAHVLKALSARKGSNYLSHCGATEKLRAMGHR
jgi:hypothetical protein